MLTRFLRALAAGGQLQRLVGIGLGRPGGADLRVEDHRAYDAALLQVVRDEQGLADLPVVTNLDFGHTDPMWTVPQGVPLRLEPQPGRLTFTQPAVL